MESLEKEERKRYLKKGEYLAESIPVSSFIGLIGKLNSATKIYSPFSELDEIHASHGDQFKEKYGYFQTEDGDTYYLCISKRQFSYKGLLEIMTVNKELIRVKEASPTKYLQSGIPAYVELVGAVNPERLTEIVKKLGEYKIK